MSCALSLLAIVVSLAQPSVDEDFEKHIRPILIENCVKCHGPAKQSGGLRLDTREALLKGGETGPAAVTGKPQDSLLLTAISYAGELRMPPRGRLADVQVARLRDWVRRGMPWPDSSGSVVSQGGTFRPTYEQREWWAFQPLRTVTPPEARSGTYSGSEIDRFILAEREKRGIASALPADRRTLLRRVSYDLIGLPPSTAEVDAFLSDDSPDAFARVVDRLLASPAYGQRWARHWLDVVRYADYHDGNPKARNPVCEPLEAWRYRDWVVKSLNRDLPFNQFIRHQIAGDLLPAPDGQEVHADGLVATTFLVNGAWDRGDADKEKMVADMVDDQIDTVGKAFMGLTLGCARCHDHKFDPVSQSDYYGLAGIFYSTRMLTELGIKGGEITLQRRPLVPQRLVDRRKRQMQQIAGLDAIIADLDRKTPKLLADDPTREVLLETRDRIRKELVPEPPLALAVSEGGVPGGLFSKIQDVPIHIRGSYSRLGPVVPRAMPAFFAGSGRTRITKGSGRLELADWVASRDNPLTARVIVNRVWQWHFGAGLVRTPNNFGRLSEPPSHPVLLDRLAARFLEDGWSLKKLHRRILLTSAYQQSSAPSPDQFSLDPENRWLGRFSPRRLEAEAIRDAMVLAAGRLDLSEGGPATDDLNTNRRSLYVQTARWDRGNFATLFDAANPDASVERRAVSTVAPQALFLLNNQFTLQRAEQIAARVAGDEPEAIASCVQRLFRIVLAREATAEETALSQRFLGASGDAAAGWPDLAHVLLCSNEFAYVE